MMCTYCGRPEENLEFDGACSNSCRLGSMRIGEYWIKRRNWEEKNGRTN